MTHSTTDLAIPGQLAPAGFSDPFLDALAEVEEELRALPAKEVLLVNLRMNAVITKVSQSTELREKLMPQIEKLGTEVNRHLFDRVLTYALAAQAADTTSALANKQWAPPPIKPLVLRLKKVRDLLSSDLETLERLEILKLKPEQRRRARGASRIATEVLNKATLLRNNWEKVWQRSHLREEELDAAAGLSAAVSKELALKKGRKKNDPKARDLRNRAFTMLIRAYSEVRRVITFLCWEKPLLLALAPPLHAEERKKPARKKPAAAIETALALPAEPKPETKRKRRKKKPSTWAEKLERKRKRGNRRPSGTR